jgi:hypothetical protein
VPRLLCVLKDDIIYSSGGWLEREIGSMKAPACAGAFTLRDDQLADAIVSASQSKSGGGHPGRDGGRHQTMRHWITSFQLLTEASDVARPRLRRKPITCVVGAPPPIRYTPCRPCHERSTQLSDGLRPAARRRRAATDCRFKTDGRCKLGMISAAGSIVCDRLSVVARKAPVCQAPPVPFRRRFAVMHNDTPHPHERRTWL